MDKEIRNTTRLAVIGIFVSGMIVGWITVGMLSASGGAGWQEYQIRQVITLLEKIEENTRP